MKRIQNRLTSVSVTLPTLLLALLLIAPVSWAQPVHLFTATYQARFYGLSGGKLLFTFRKGDQPNEFVYESRAQPSFLGSFMISSSARESCTMTFDDNDVRPLKFLSDDGKRGEDNDSNLTYDWVHHRLTGRSERVDFDQALPKNVQDHLSIQIAVMQALQNGSELDEYSLVDSGEIKRYRYTKEGAGSIKYKNQTLDATIIRSERSDSPGGRITRYWHAPALHFLPVHAERSRNGKIDLTLDLMSDEFAE